MRWAAGSPPSAAGETSSSSALVASRSGRAVLDHVQRRGRGRAVTVAQSAPQLCADSPPSARDASASSVRVSHSLLRARTWRPVKRTGSKPASSSSWSRLGVALPDCRCGERGGRRFRRPAARSRHRKSTLIALPSASADPGVHLGGREACFRQKARNASSSPAFGEGRAVQVPEAPRTGARRPAAGLARSIARCTSRQVEQPQHAPPARPPAPPLACQHVGEVDERAGDGRAGDAVHGRHVIGGERDAAVDVDRRSGRGRMGWVRRRRSCAGCRPAGPRARRRAVREHRASARTPGRPPSSDRGR